MAPAGEIHKWFVGPVCFVKVERVLFRLAIVRNQTFVVATADAAFVSPVTGKIKHVPDERAPDERATFHLRPGFFMQQGLPLFRMPLAVVARLSGTLLV